MHSGQSLVVQSDLYLVESWDNHWAQSLVVHWELHLGWHLAPLWGCLWGRLWAACGAMRHEPWTMKLIDNFSTSVVSDF